jgi:hypothetical protein
MNAHTAGCMRIHGLRGHKSPVIYAFFCLEFHYVRLVVHNETLNTSYVLLQTSYEM